MGGFWLEGVSEISLDRILMKEEETGEWRRRYHIVNIYWFYMAVCIPFLVTTPQSFPLGTRSILNLWNSSGADIIPLRVLLPHPACKPQRWHVNQARLIRPILKYFLNSWKKFVLFCFVLSLGCYMIQDFW